MNIAIVGTGMVGGALARAWSARGHVITLAVRDSAKPEVVALADEIGASVHPIAPEAVADAEVVVLAVPADSAQATAASLGGLSGLTVVDPTNPIASDFSKLTVGTTTSSAEQLAETIREAHVVKAFNIIGSHRFDDPVFAGEVASMLIAGDDDEAKRTVIELAASLGFDTVDVGPLTESRFLEPLAMLWIRLTYVQQAGNVAFRLLHD